ncbi:MAG: polysaccharide deacetylase family protein [Pseudomonadales bacterium]
MYHRVADLAAYDQLTVTVETFDRQMSALASRHCTIDMETAVALLESGDVPRQGTVVLSFDDGYLDNLENALPILEKYQLPAIVFVTTEFADQSASHPRYPQEQGSLHLNWDQLRALSKHPLISIGSHTLSHPYLQSVSDAHSREEIERSKSTLERELDQDIDYFCYPSGDFSERELKTLASSQYRAAVTVAPGANVVGRFRRFELTRTEVTDRDKGMMFSHKLIGAMDPIHRLLHWRRKRQFQQQAIAVPVTSEHYNATSSGTRNLESTKEIDA